MTTPLDWQALAAIARMRAAVALARGDIAAANAFHNFINEIVKLTTNERN